MDSGGTPGRWRQITAIISTVYQPTIAARSCTDFFTEHTRGYINPQCHVQPDKRFVWADLSVAEGGLGLEVLRIAHESAAEDFRATHSGCTTDMSHVI